MSLGFCMCSKWSAFFRIILGPQKTMCITCLLLSDCNICLSVKVIDVFICPFLCCFCLPVFIFILFESLYLSEVLQGRTGAVQDLLGCGRWSLQRARHGDPEVTESLAKGSAPDGLSSRCAQAESARLSPQTGGQGGAQDFEEGRLRRRVYAKVGTSHVSEPD